MIFVRSSRFAKEFKKQKKDIQNKVLERLALFTVNQFDPLLNNHKLRYEYGEYRSINVTGDFRIVYRMVDTRTCFLFRIGNHQDLFGL